MTANNNRKKRRTRRAPDAPALEFDFDSVALSCEKVRIGGSTYTLWEVGTDVNAKYRSAMFARGDMSPQAIKRGEALRMECMVDLDIYLLSLCLIDDQTGAGVPEDALRKWPNRITEPLIQRMKQMSGMLPMDEEEFAAYEEHVGNSPDGSTDGSA